MQSTRQEILDYLHRHGKAPVKELGQTLGLTSTGIRQHLTILQRDGLVSTEEERGRVGRPALIYALTEKAENLYPTQYDALANLLIEEVRTIVSGQGVQTLLQRVATRIAEPYMKRAESLAPEPRARYVRDVLAERGTQTAYERDGDDFLIHQYTCPYPTVARRNSAVCAMEVGLVSRMCGGDARLTSSLLRGDNACTFRIRPRRDDAATVAHSEG